MKKHFIISIILFIIYIFIYLFEKEMISILYSNIYITIIFFVYFLYKPLIVLIPQLNNNIHNGRLFTKNYIQKEYIEKNELFRKYSVRAYLTLLLWFTMLLVIYTFKIKNFIGIEEILLIFFFFNLSDYICITLFCPFEKILIRNSCCNECRIYNYDHFFRNSPLIFLGGLFSTILFLVGVYSLISWEYSYFKKPEKFHKETNSNINCSNCTSYCKKG